MTCTRNFLKIYRQRKYSLHPPDVYKAFFFHDKFIHDACKSYIYRLQLPPTILINYLFNIQTIILIINHTLYNWQKLFRFSL